MCIHGYFVQCCVLQILGLLELLVNYGYYCNLTSVKNVVQPLIAMLDGRIDIPHASESMQLLDKSGFQLAM